MGDRFRLHGLAFPKGDICGEVEMYYKGVGFALDGGAVFAEGGYLSADTYFNSFSLSKWKTYAGLDNATLTLRLKGRFAVGLYVMAVRGGELVRTCVGEAAAEGDFECALPLDEEGVFYFTLTALGEGCALLGGEYSTLPARPLNRVKLAVGICTYRREEFITANLRRFAEALSAGGSLRGAVKVFVADNGGTLPAEELCDENILVTPNENRGGASGFTRCLMEALRSGEDFTNFLFLDDDIVLDTEAIARNISLLALLLPEHEDSIIGGAMFATDEKYLQFESGAKWDTDHFIFNRRDSDMREALNVALNEEEYDLNYNAWCYCCIPFDKVSAVNLPLPVFFHMDDVEYCLRLGLPVITLNGINVWHLYKRGLVNAKTDYYDVRNKLIMLSEVNPDVAAALAHIYISSFGRETLKYHYARSINAFDAIIDFCKGFDSFKTADPSSVHSGLFENVAWKEADEGIRAAAHASSGFPKPETRKYLMKAALAQILAPKRGRNVVYWDNTIADVRGYRSVSAYLPTEDKVITYKKKLGLAIRAWLKHRKAKKLARKKLPAVAREFNHRITEVQNSEFWERYLGLPLTEKGKKVLFVASDNDATSGAFRSMTALCTILRDKFGLNVWVLLPCEGDGAELLRAAKLKYTEIDSENWIIPIDAPKRERKRKIKRMRKVNPAAIKSIEEFMRQEKFDLVHINTSYSYVGAIAAKKLGIPVVWHIREFLEEDQRRTMVGRKKGYALMAKSDRLVAISDSILGKYAPVFEDRVTRIYNGIDTSVFLREDKTVLCGDKAVLMCVGTIEEYKGQGQAVEAAVRLKEKYGDAFELWLVGNDTTEYADALRSFAALHGIENNVKFLGRRQDVAELYKQSDIACICSRAEAFGRITVEAMLSGNLVIGADTAGTKELIGEGDGLLYKSGDSESLFEKLDYALENKEIAREFAAHGRRSAAEKFTAERNAQEIFRLYGEIWKR